MSCILSSVVETQVALAAVFLGQAEVDADALGVADMQVAVGFGRETVARALCLRAAIAQRNGADSGGLSFLELQLLKNLS